MGAALAFGFLGLCLFACVAVGGFALAARVWARPWSSLPLIALAALLAYAPFLLLGRPPHGSHPTGVGVRLAFVWLAECQVLYGVPLVVFPLAVVRWVFRLGAGSRPT